MQSNYTRVGRTVRGDYTFLSYCVEPSPINKSNASEEHVLVLVSLHVEITECPPGLETVSSTAQTRLNLGQLHCGVNNSSAHAPRLFPSDALLPRSLGGAAQRAVTNYAHKKKKKKRIHFNYAASCLKSPAQPRTHRWVSFWRATVIKEHKEPCSSKNAPWPPL